MKLVVQIPCLNEEATLPLVLKDIPKKIVGIDEIAILIIDDGCSDDTVAVAKAHGVKHFVHHPQTQGLGRSFHDGIQAALALGADIVVNTDGDNQYPQNRIGDLVQPIIRGVADIVVADRQTNTISHFSPAKKLLQRVGSRVVNIAAGSDIPDAPSGFRAYSKESLLRLNTITRFSYTMETIIQAGNKGIATASIKVNTNAKLRESRLFKSNWEHVRKSGITIIRAYIMYKPYIVFGWLGGISFLLAMIPFVRFTVMSIEDGTTHGHIQSLLVGSLFMTAAFLCLVLNIIADLIRINRTLIEDNLEQTKRLRFR
ncbi:MAG: glycosyltransferase family 2 protein [Candidatus Saccharibacteria bacterium]|nr:glycosyltransferase family 2 protein [Candidatus Saccharibacteria bacterium]